MYENLFNLIDDLQKVAINTFGYICLWYNIYYNYPNSFARFLYLYWSRRGYYSLYYARDFIFHQFCYRGVIK